MDTLGKNLEIGRKRFFQKHNAWQCIIDIPATHQFQSQFCYTTGDFAIYCAQFKLLEILNDILVYLFAIRIRPAAVNLAVIPPSEKKVW